MATSSNRGRVVGSQQGLLQKGAERSETKGDADFTVPPRSFGQLAVIDIRKRFY
jgi:hypothetical protein